MSTSDKLDDLEQLRRDARLGGGEERIAQQHARGKLIKKSLDLIAANEVGDAKAFDAEDNELIVLSREWRREPGKAPKLVLARRLIGVIAQSFAARAGTSCGARA